MVFGVIFAGLECFFFNYPLFRNHYETQLYKSHRSTSQCIKGYDSSLSVCSVSCTVQLQLFTRGNDNSLPVCSVSCTVQLQLFTRGNDNSLPVCSVSCTVHLQLFTRGEDSSLPVCSVSCLYTYNCLLRMICYRLGQNQLLINKKAVLSRYSLWPTKLVMDYRISSLYTL